VIRVLAFLGVLVLLYVARRACDTCSQFSIGLDEAAGDEVQP